MASSRSNSFLALALLFSLLNLQLAFAQLSSTYYNKTCPNVEKIIHDVMVQKQKESFVTAAGVLRLFFHDCFVTGCDASVLLPSGATKAEKDADENLSLPGDAFDAVIRAKTALEKKCPGVVSCADILTIATRDLVGLVKGPNWPVLMGRKDSRVSLASNVPGNLPKPTMNVDQLTQVFNRKGFTQQEMIILSGGHTVGFAHCGTFLNRIYNFSKTAQIDPTMSTTYAMDLRQACPNHNLDPTVVAFNDVTTPKTFDNAFFKNTQKGLGLLNSDQILWTDKRTRGFVNSLAVSNDAFFKAWIPAIQKLSKVGVKLTGEVRKRCDAIN